MSKQILVKTLARKKETIRNLTEEIIKYIQVFDFKKTPLMIANNQNSEYSSAIFTFEQETILIEYIKKPNEEILRLCFSPLQNEMIHDLVMMKINQTARLQQEDIFIHRL
ncbi:MAG: hypothetical protein V1859_00490 [archaeon]